MSELLTRLRGRRAKIVLDEWAAYRALLERHDKPRKGDEEELEGLMGALNLTADDVETHLAALAEAARLLALLPPIKELEAAIGPGQAEVYRLRGEAKRAAEQAQAAGWTHIHNCTRLTTLTTEVIKVKQLKAKFPRLLENLEVPP